MRKIEYINHKVLSLHFIIAKEGKDLVFIGSECAGVEELYDWFKGEDAYFIEACPRDFLSIVDKLERYYRGEEVDFDEPMNLEGTPMQLAVWEYIRKIPYGTTKTYKEVAYDLGYPLAIRAIASAVGKNPLLIMIPCHRVLGSNGQMRGYRGGLAMKHRLLSLEKEVHDFGSVFVSGHI